MRKTFLLFGIACLLAACSGNGYSPIQYEKFDEQVSVTSPDGGVAGMTLTVDIPVGEGEVQNRITEGIRTIIKESQVEEELKQPVEGPLKDVCKNLVDYFQKAITTGEYDPAGALAFDLMVECEHQNEQAVFFHVTDGVFGNGAPSECYKIIRLSDGHLMEDAEVASVPVDDLMKLIQKYGDKDQKDIDEGWLMDYTYLCPIADSCKVLYLYGSHFWNTITVPMSEVSDFLTEEGKVLLGVKDGLATKHEITKKDDEQEVQEDVAKPAEFANILDNLTFASPKILIRPTNLDVNVRVSPSAKAAKATFYDETDKKRYNLTKSSYEILGAEQENDGWYKIPEGWISKSEAKPASNDPILPKMLNRLCAYNTSYDDGIFWIVANIQGAHNLCVLYREVNNFWPTPSGLWLGKQVGNIFVFKYYKEIDVFKALSTYEIPTTEKNRFMHEVPDFSRFDEKMLEELFGGEIKGGKINYCYINSELLSDEYANWVFE